jgi:N-acetylgalactosamine-6-sulfatase
MQPGPLVEVGIIEAAAVLRHFILHFRFFKGRKKMKRREFLKSCAAFAAAGFIPSCGPVEVRLTPRPNIVFIYADDWGYGDLSCHGHPEAKTPNIDRLAAEGTDFSLFTVNNPVCSPSRAAVMTGKYPARFCIHGHFARMERNKKRGMPDWLDSKVVQLPRLFKEAGYVTGHFGKWHLTNANIHDAPAVSEYGYDEWLVFGHRDGVEVQEHYKTAEAAVKFIRKNKDKPFFVNLWLHETHVAHFRQEVRWRSSLIWMNSSRSIVRR